MSADQELAQTGATVAVGAIGAISALVVGGAILAFKAIAYKAANHRN